MRRLLAAMGLAALCGTAWAESGSRGYLFLGPGGRSGGGGTASHYYMGGGGELMLGKGIAAAVEVQGVVPQSGAGRGTFGIFSLNGAYHPLYANTGKIDPFVTAGYSLAFRTGTANLWNYGFGMNYWFRDKLGLLVEFRDHPWSSGRTTLHYWGFRFGLSFR